MWGIRNVTGTSLISLVWSRGKPLLIIQTSYLHKRNRRLAREVEEKVAEWVWDLEIHIYKRMQEHHPVLDFLL